MVVPRLNLQLQPFVHRDNFPRPAQYAQALGGETFKIIAAVDQAKPEFFLKIFQAHRQRRLADKTRLRRPAKMPLALEITQVDELFDVQNIF